MTSIPGADEAIIFPVLRYKDGPEALSWLNKAFGLRKHFEALTPDGGIAHAQMTLGSGMIMLGSKSAHPDPKNPWSRVEQGVYVYVADIDGHFRRATEAGADIATPLRNTDYGAREYSVRDLDGYLWSFGTYQPWQRS